jgi:hypothetical protein
MTLMVGMTLMGLAGGADVFELEAWQWAIVVVVAVVCVGYMAFTIARMRTRRAGSAATLREGTAVESGIVGADPPPDADVFDAFSYRVTARFAGRVRIAVYPDRIAVAGPRAPRVPYWMWIWAQGLLLALVPATLAGALVAFDWRLLLLALGIALASWTISIIGAGVWPGLGESAIIDDGRFRALESRRDAVRDVTVGPGWSNGGMAVVLLPYKKAIDSMAGPRAVSWYAPDEAGREVRYALHLYSDEDAERLAALLRGSG